MTIEIVDLPMKNRWFSTVLFSSLPEDFWAGHPHCKSGFQASWPMMVASLTTTTVYLATQKKPAKKRHKKKGHINRQEMTSTMASSTSTASDFLPTFNALIERSSEMSVRRTRSCARDHRRQTWFVLWKSSDNHRDFRKSEITEITEITSSFTTSSPCLPYQYVWATCDNDVVKILVPGSRTAQRPQSSKQWFSLGSHRSHLVCKRSIVHA